MIDEEDLAEVTGAVEDVSGKVENLSAFVRFFLVAWSIIGGLWLYKHW